MTKAEKAEILAHLEKIELIIDKGAAENGFDNHYGDIIQNLYLIKSNIRQTKTREISNKKLIKLIDDRIKKALNNQN